MGQQPIATSGEQISWRYRGTTNNSHKFVTSSIGRVEGAAHLGNLFAVCNSSAVMAGLLNPLPLGRAIRQN